MTFTVFVIVVNIAIGWYNIIRSNQQFQDGHYSSANLSFVCAFINIMLALGIVAREVYLIIEHQIKE